MSTADTPNPNVRESREKSVFYRWNASLLREFNENIFSPDLNADHSLNRLGRGTAVMFDYQGLNLVLRHYQRGGLVRFVNRDLYPFFRLAHTRMWREFDLLLQLQALGLPAPIVVAARCEKVLFGFCRGDLITRTIPNARTLAQVLQSQSLAENQWRELGALLARFHIAGIFHADLNANNVLMDDAAHFYLLDFDRGELRDSNPSWQGANLARLLRSLHKCQKRCSRFHFQPSDWSALLLAYNQGSSS
jgi:3-deoxy-D-manno-octulosonic acid kinase